MNWTASRVSALVVVTVVGPLVASAAAAAGCPFVRTLRHQQRWAEAERAARACLQQRPEDVAVWVSLARALAARQRYTEALRWASKAARRYPRDLDVALLQIRLCAWAGDLPRARALLAALPEQLKRGTEATKLAGDLSFWLQDNAAAVAAYSAYLQHSPDDAEVVRLRGIAHQRLQRVDSARADFTKACALQGGGGQGCVLLSELERDRARFALLVRPVGRFVIDQGNGWQFDGQFAMRLGRALRFGTRIELRNRTFGTESLTDTYLHFFSSYRHQSGLSISVAGGATVDPSFSPVWTVEVEPGYGFPFGLEAYVKYWQLKFRGRRAHVVSPALLHSWRRWSFYLRYFLAVDKVRGVGHQVLGRVDRALGRQWQVYVGAGGGNRSDFIEPRETGANDQPVQRSIIAFGGVTREFGWRHWAQLSYLLRNERAGGESYTENQVGAAYGLRF